jgi:DNA-binding response OmpR family regulator
MPKPRILIVDDEPGLLRVLTLMLMKRYDVLAELDATQALEAALKFKPHLVLLDLVMPKIPGEEVARQIRADPRICDTPVLFLSAIILKRETPIEVAGYPAIAKPIGMNELVVVIEEQLRMAGMKELIELVDGCCPSAPRRKRPPQRPGLPRRNSLRHEGRKSNVEEDNKLKALIAQVFGCISEPNGTTAPTCDAKILNVNHSLRILSMTESWTFAPSRVLHLKIDRTEPDFAILVTVSVNDGKGQNFDESKTKELLAHIREQVTVLTA